MERIVARRALLAAAVVGIVAQALFVGLAFGVNVVVATALVLAAAATLGRLAGRRPDPLDGWLPIAAGLVAVGTALRSDDTLMFLDAVTAATLVGASVAAFAGAAVTRRSMLAIVGLGSVVLLWVTIGILRLSETARRPGPDGPRRSLSAPARGVVRGLALAVPLLLVFGLLFASADAIFASFAGHLVDWQVDLGELPLRTGVAFLIAWVVAGLLAVATGIGEIRLPSDAHSDRARRGRPAADAIAGRDGRDAGTGRGSHAAPRHGRGAHDPRRGRRAVRAVRRAPAGLPVRRARHDGRRRHHVRELRPARLLRARRGDVPRRLRRRRAPRGRRRSGPGRSWPRRSRSPG